MRFARPKFFFLLLLLNGFFFVLPVFAQTGAESSQSDLSDIKTRLAALEKQQNEIITKEDQILAELDRIRVWVRRK